ncbi:hypothetical protein [Pedobacter sp. Leaf250]|uniref:hypothetical protein n=1 Tax=Pedobacter sp. Leaf250 TaxID=2876559 RepID=UPI001E57DB9E|nr:hypothetical protein [Pedobacter sp. Leaf250]
MKNIFFPIIIIVALFSACSGKNADGTPNVSNGDSTQIDKPATADSTDSTTNAPADVKHK